MTTVTESIAVPTTPAARRRRFRRSTATNAARSGALQFELRPRDIDMVAAIARHRFMNTTQVCRLFACDCPRIARTGQRRGKPVTIHTKQHRANCACTCGVETRTRPHADSCPALFKDDQHVGSRLRELYQAGYVERPITQLQLRVKDGAVAPGSVPMVYSVTATGLALLSDTQRAALGPGRLSWVGKPNAGSRVFLDHTLATTDVSTAVDAGLRTRPEYRRLTEQELCAGMPAARRASSHRWSLPATYKTTKLSAVCDLPLGIRTANGRKQWNFLIEVDRGHMPIERHDLASSSIVRKLLAYAKAHHDGAHLTHFGWRGFRVVVLTTSEARMRSCVAAARARFGAAAAGRLFLFGTMDAVSNLLDYEFSTIDGRGCRLLG
jgi:Replication-relaxation